MTLRRAMLAAALACVGAVAAQAEGGLSLGVTTQFGQGWPTRFLPLATRSSGDPIRESISWRLVEGAPGAYRFTPANAGHVDRLCAAGKHVLLALNPRHPLYDNGMFPVSPNARDAFAGFVVALAERYRGCLAAIELGNEINAKNGFDGRPAAANRFAAYTELLRSLRDRVKPRYPNVALLGGSTNVVATGFLGQLFAAGALPLMDGVVVHPYRRDPQNLDWEIGRLVDMMRRHGRVVPVWATEFSSPADGLDQAAFLAKTVTLLSAAGVQQAGWYALVDQPRFPTMGLYTTGGTAKPVAQAFDYLNRSVLPRGAAVRAGGDPNLFLYRFGPDRQILWGAPRRFAVNGPAVFRDASGRTIAKPDEVGETPIFIEGQASVVPGPQRVLADSLYGYARPPWSYWVERATQPPLALVPVDWQWASYIGSLRLRQLSIGQNAIMAGGGGVPLKLVIRYTATANARAYAAACFMPQRPGAGVSASYAVLRNGQPIGEPAALSARREEIAPLTIAEGDRIDFRITFLAGAPMTPIAYRLRVVTSPRDAPAC
jgi:hypothetical protein